MMDHQAHGVMMDEATASTGATTASAPCNHEKMMSMMSGGGMGHAGHGMSHGGGGGGHAMTFYHSTSATLLFSGIQVGPDLITYLVACVLVVLLGVARQELVKQSELETHSTEKRVFFYFCQATISYLLMLIAMTFNIGLFLAVLVGLTAGYYRSLMQQQQAKIANSAKSECCA